MAEIGKYNTLTVVKRVDFGMYLDGGDGEEILLPKRYVPRGLKEGDDIEVFLYHDNEGRVIATTAKPKGIIGDIVQLEVVSSNASGAFMDMGLMKDIFLPLSLQESRIYVGGKYLVKIIIDEQTGRLTATERLWRYISNDELTVKELDPVDLVVQRRTDTGFAVIINNVHEGLLYYSDVFRDLEIGDKVKGFIKKIHEYNKIDVALGERGYVRVEGEAEKVMRLLQENEGYLPYFDKSDPEDIYEFFGMSKKTFKMVTGALYKQRKIEFTKSGIKLAEG